VQTVTKTYQDLPAAHRQHNHSGHCRLIHGHNWRFDITFACDTLDECGFVIDVGKLENVKHFLETTFDHTLLLNSDDPTLTDLCFSLKHLADIVTVPNCGMEGLARFVQAEVENIIRKPAGAKERGLVVSEVTCWEDSKNRATYLFGK